MQHQRPPNKPPAQQTAVQPDLRSGNPIPKQPVPNPASQGKRKSKKRNKGLVPMKSPKSLIRLRDRVEEAAREIVRLRAENAALAQRLQDLEAQQDAPTTGTTLTFEDNPDTLRRQVEGFITAIDRYLEQENHQT